MINCTRLIRSLVEKFQRLRIASLSLPGRMQISVQEHEKIIEAFRNKDAILAEKLVTQECRVWRQRPDAERRRKPAAEARRENGSDAPRPLRNFRSHAADITIRSLRRLRQINQLLINLSDLCHTVDVFISALRSEVKSDRAEPIAEDSQG